MSENKKYWEGFDYALSLLEEMYGSSNFQHPYNIADCVKAKVNRLPQEQIRTSTPVAPDAVEFAEWIDGCGYSRIPYEDRYGEWVHSNAEREDIVANTTVELFQMFKSKYQKTTPTNVQEQDDKDSFAIGFAAWAMYSPDAERYKAAGVSAQGLLEKYKNRPFVSNDMKNQ